MNHGNQEVADAVKKKMCFSCLGVVDDGSLTRIGIRILICKFFVRFEKVEDDTIQDLSRKVSLNEEGNEEFEGSTK